MPNEFLDLLDELRSELGLRVLLQRARGIREEWNGDQRGMHATSRVFVADAGPFDAETLADESSPARYGWVLLDVPRIDEDRLFAIQVAVRSDWFDKETGTVCKHKRSLRQFDKVWKLMASRLRFPIMAKNLATGAEASYASIGCSAGAEEWLRRGGKLRQQGVENIDFFVPNATSA